METNPRILVVEDQESIRTCLEQILRMSGFQVLVAGDGREALAVLRANEVDLILADIVMPNMDGFQLFERIVENPKWVRIPFIYLSARVLESDIRYGKELGVDDYLIKPVQTKELLAVVRGKLRRAQRVMESANGTPRQPSQQPEPASGIIRLGRLEIEGGEYRVWLDDQPVNLSNTEFLLLEHLALKANKVVPLSELIKVTHSLEAGYREASDLLRPLVRSIRRKLGYDAGDLGCIEAVRGVGYRLVPPSDV
jgi:DNA-binding response OmpR family regulator